MEETVQVPIKSYGEMGLGEEFRALVAKRQELQRDYKPKEKQVKDISKQLKLALAQVVLGTQVAPEEDELIVAAAETEEARCSVGPWQVAMTVTGRDSLDQTKLKLELLGFGLTSDQIEAAFTAATEKKQWAELVVVQEEPREEVLPATDSAKSAGKEWIEPEVAKAAKHAKTRVKRTAIMGSRKHGRQTGPGPLRTPTVAMAKRGRAAPRGR